MGITVDQIVRRSPELVSASLDEATVFMSVASDSYFMLEGSARDIWDLIDGQRKVGEIVARLTEIYDIDAQACEADVLAFLAALSDNGMIEITG